MNAYIFRISRWILTLSIVIHVSAVKSHAYFNEKTLRTDGLFFPNKVSKQALAFGLNPDSEKRAAKIRNAIREELESVTSEPSFSEKIEAAVDSRDWMFINKTCRRDVLKVLFDLIDLQLYAIQIFDATAKLPAGLTDGYIFWFGSFDMCMDIKKDCEANCTNSRDIPMDANYCLAPMSLSLGDISLPILMGVCVPKTCSPQDVEHLLTLDIFQNIIGIITGREKSEKETTADSRIILIPGPEVSGTECQIDREIWDVSDYIAAIISFLAVALAVIATLYEGFKYGLYTPDTPELEIVRPLPPQWKKDCGDELRLETISEQIDEDEKIVSNEKDVNENVVRRHISKGSKIDNIELMDPLEMIEPSQVLTKRTQPLWERLLLCFSVVTNAKKLFCTVRPPQDRYFRMLDGMKSISIIWIILGHSFMYAIPTLDNLIQLSKALKETMFLLVLNAHFAVDTFLLASGMLVTFWTLERLKKGEGRTVSWWIHFYFHRWWRLTPVFAYTVLMYVSLYFRLTHGPLYTFDSAAPHDCEKNWWATLLYIHNFYPTNNMDKCYKWTWYLACDMQLFIFSPIIILTLYKNRKVGVTLTAILTAASMVTTFVISYSYGLPATVIGSATSENANPDIDYIYQKPYTRAAPYLLGMMLGHYFSTMKNRRIRLHRGIIMLGWLCSIAVAFTLVFGLAKSYEGFPDYRPSDGMAALYNSTHRFAWALSMAWVIWACQTGNAGPVNAILSWAGFGPMSKLVYSVFIMHPDLMIVYYYNLQKPIHFFAFTMVMLVFGHVMVDFLFCLGLSLLIEVPMTALERVLIKH